VQSQSGEAPSGERFGVIAGTLCDPCLSTLSVRYYKKRAM